ncbi:MAG: helix-turn-helix domain-containing protein [Clostridia bacterium]|nr:helix-turn-helix domain-containing protein [Clostridia bacterium]
MDQEILQHFSEITEEEKQFLSGGRQIDRTLYMDGSRDVISGDKLLEKGKQIAIRPHTRFVHFPEHTHDYVEMVYMCRGETTHLVNGTKIVLKQGELLMLGQHARQEIEPAGEEDIAVNLIVRPAFLQGILSFLGNEETPLRGFVLNCLSGNTETGYLYFRVSEVLPVQNLIENLLWTMIHDHANRRGIYQMTLGLLMAELLEHTDSLRFSSPEEEIIVQALRYIEEHYRDGSLTELSQLTHYDFAALSRLIKNRTGKTYTDLIQEKRLSQAAWLLTNTGKRVDEIARLTGYENISYFHRLFSSRFGVSPRQYRICK